MTTRVLVVPTEKTMTDLMDLAAVVAALIGGPYAHLGLTLLRILGNQMAGYRIPPEFQKYYDSLEELTEAYNKRHGGKET